MEFRETIGNPEVPGWFEKYRQDVEKSGKDLLKEVELLATMKKTDLEEHLGGGIRELPYEVLETLFIDGSDDASVADVLRSKRKAYLETHPEKQIAKGASEGIITYDGRFIPKKQWDSASDSEKRGALVGSTCFHYESETPGMGSSPQDRF